MKNLVKFPKFPTSVFLLLVVGVVLFLHGCQYSERKKTITKVTFAAETDANTIEIYKKLIADFEKKNPGIKIVPFYIPSNYYAKILAMFASGTQPDLFWMGQGFGDFAKRGCLLELENEIDPEIIKKIASFAPEVLNLYKYKGKLMGVPTGINVALLIYNVSLFDKAGVKYPEDNWTIKDFLNTAKALTKDLNGDGKNDQFGVFIDSFKWLMNSFAGSIISKDGTRCEIASPPSVEALGFMRDLITKYKVSPRMVGGETEGFVGQEPFLTGKIGMTVVLDIHLSRLRKIVKNFEWDIAPIPCKEKRRYWASSSGFCIATGTKNKKEALAFVEYLASDHFAQKNLSEIAIPVMKEVAEEVISQTTQPKHIGCLMEIIKDINPTPRIPGITQIETIARNWEEKVYLGTITPENACREAAKEIENVLKQSKQ